LSPKLIQPADKRQIRILFSSPHGESLRLSSLLPALYILAQRDRTRPHSTQGGNMDRNSEKLGVDQIDDNAAYQTDSHTLDNEFTPAEQKRIMQRIDRRLVTTVGFMYCVSLMDRTNLGAAIIAGMGKELMLIGDRYVSPEAIPLLIVPPPV
jgi:hypothetical protein